MGRAELHRVYERGKPSGGGRDLPDARKVLESEVDAGPAIAEPNRGAERAVDSGRNVLAPDPVSVAIGDDRVAPGGGSSLENETKTAPFREGAHAERSHQRLELARRSPHARPLVDARERRRRGCQQEPG